MSASCFIAAALCRDLSSHTGHLSSVFSSGQKDAEASLPPPSCFIPPVETLHRMVCDSERVSKSPVSHSLSPAIRMLNRNEGDGAWLSALRSHGETCMSNPKVQQSTQDMWRVKALSSDLRNKPLAAWNPACPAPRGSPACESSLQRIPPKWAHKDWHTVQPCATALPTFCSNSLNPCESKAKLDRSLYFIFSPNSSGWELLSRPGFR